MYKFISHNKDQEDFSLSYFHWSLILEQCGTYFVALSKNARWFYVTNIDERMGTSEYGPAIIFHEGFEITEEESKVLARISKNYCIIQKETEDQKEVWIPLLKKNLLLAIEDFSEWAEKSHGFKIM